MYISVTGLARNDALPVLVIAPSALAGERNEFLGREPFEQLEMAQGQARWLNHFLPLKVLDLSTFQVRKRTSGVSVHDCGCS